MEASCLPSQAFLGAHGSKLQGYWASVSRGTCQLGQRAIGLLLHSRSLLEGVLDEQKIVVSSAFEQTKKPATAAEHLTKNTPDTFHASYCKIDTPNWTTLRLMGA
jgi:hypothetical protein